MVVFFGAVVPRYDVDFRKAVDLAVDFEGLEFSSLWCTDHLQPRRASRVLETWTLLSALAPVTDVRLGTVVLCSCYRHPSVLAKMAATLDVVSGGRLELGLGTGSESQNEELEALGLEVWKDMEKLGRFREYVEVVRLLMKDEGVVDFNGRFYKLSKAVRNTPPVQKPTPPIWVGGRRRKMVEAAAEIGDGWNFYGESVEEYRQIVKVYDEACKKAGRRPAKSIFTNTVVYTSEEDRLEKIRKLGEFNSVEEALRKTFTLLYGKPDEVIEQVGLLQSLGVGMLVLRDIDVDGSSLRVFAREVLPSFS